VVADSLSISARWRNTFSQLLNVHGFNHVSRETVEPIVPEPSAFEVELVTEKLKDKNQQVLIEFQQN
jgi:hypothetical protein